MPSDRLTLLSEAAGTLLSNLDAGALISAILDTSQRLFQADAYAVWRLFPEAEVWHSVADRNLSAAYARSTPNGDLSLLPDHPVFTPDVLHEPLLAARHAAYRSEGIRAMLHLPLRICGAKAGTVVFYFRQPRALKPEDLEAAQALGNLAAAALTNAELYAQQRRAAEAAAAAASAATSAEQRLSFLAETSAILSSTLDLEETLQHVAQLAVSYLADWCIIHLQEEAGTVRPVALAHADPEKTREAWRLQERYPVDLEQPRGVAQVLRTGQSEYFSEVPDELLVVRAQDAEHLELLRSVGFRSGVMAPLQAKGRTVGVLTLVTAESGRLLSESDLHLAEALATRAGAAIENARLYTHAQAALAAAHQTEHALRHSEERYRSLTEATSAIVWTSDPEGRFLVPQSSWEAYTGQPWDEHRDFGWSEVLHPDDRGPLLQVWNQAVCSRSLCAVEGRLWHAPSEEYRYSAVRAVPILGPDGAVLEWIGAVADVHERRRAEEQLREETRAIETIHHVGQVLAGELDLQKLLQSLTDAATQISDAEFGSFFYHQVTGGADEAMVLYTLSGAPREAFERFPLPRATGIFAPTLVQGRVLRLDDVTQDPRFGQNAPYHGLPAGHLPVRSYLALPVASRTGEVLGALFFGHSAPAVFTERHERILTAIAAQAAIAIDNARLYQRAQVAAYAAEQQAMELAEANRRKDEFISMLSHELRNPLAGISNAVAVLQRHGPQEPQLVRLREIIARQTHNLTRIVNDLLDVSRLIHGRIELRKERLDLAAVVTRVIESCREAVDARNHQLSVLTPLEQVELEADPTRLEQILCNLLDNAAKYTEPGGSLMLTAEREESEGNSWVVLRVKDTGIGMPPDLLPRVFELFTQAERSLDRTLGGLGIGLTVVLRLVELHGGTIQAFSEGAGKGSEFVVRLPAVPQAPPAAGPQRAKVPTVALPLPQLRVLLVDDLVDAAVTLAELLEDWGLEVRVAHHGPRAVEIATEFQPEVVLLDLGLPGWDGYEVARQLQALPGSDSRSIIALTGYGQEEDRQRTAAAGFAAHLAKPVDLSELQRVLASPLRPSRSPAPGGRPASVERM